MESPKYLILQVRDAEALKSIKMCYHHSEDHDEILAYLKSNVSTTTDSVSYKQALCDPGYRLTTYILIAGVTFFSLNGGQVFAFYG